MNRCLEYGEKIKMINVNQITCSVDTIEDLKKAEYFMKNDNLFKSTGELSNDSKRLSKLWCQ